MSTAIALKKFYYKYYFHLFLIVMGGFILTTHSRYQFLSIFLAPVICLIVLLGIKFTNKLKILIPIVIFSIANAYYSIFNQNSIIDIFRFFIVIIFSLLAFYYERPIYKNRYLILIPFLIQAIFIIVISNYLFFSNNLDLAKDYRDYFLINNIGDVYPSSRHFYKVQLIGNALIPLVFFICLMNAHEKLYKFTAIIMAAGVLAAANLSYVITSYIALLIFLYKNIKYRGTVLLLIMILASGIASIYFYESLWEKFIPEVGTPSMEPRFAQLTLIFTELNKSVINILFGYGLGARLPGELSSTRYIEVQFLYIAYQIGFVGVLIYLSTIATLIIRFLTKTGITVFILNVLCSLMNPYLFDSNQILGTILIVIYFSKINESIHT